MHVNIAWSVAALLSQVPQHAIYCISAHAIASVIRQLQQCFGVISMLATLLSCVGHELILGSALLEGKGCIDECLML
jgi:hypothetical protein